MSPPKKRGCLFYGCLSLVIVGLLATVVLVSGYFLAKRTYNNLVNDFTAATPEPIESVSYPPAENEALQQRLQAFKTTLDSGKGELELVLTAADLNALIAENPELKGKLFVMIEGDKVRGKVSWPLPDVGPLKLKGRYLNGMVTFRVSLEGGVLNVGLDDIKVKSNALPAVVVSEFKKQNLAQEFQKDPKQQAEIRKFESIRIEDDKVYLRSKAAP